jgi:hypothetical protein
MPVELAAAWTATAYALFSPHLTPTEDVVMVAVMLWAWRSCPARRLLAALCLGVQLCGGATFALLFQLGRPGASLLPLAAFAAKLGVLALLAATLVYARRLGDDSVSASP